MIVSVTLFLLIQLWSACDYCSRNSFLEKKQKKKNTLLVMEILHWAASLQYFTTNRISIVDYQWINSLLGILPLKLPHPFPSHRNWSHRGGSSRVCGDSLILKHIGLCNSFLWEVKDQRRDICQLRMVAKAIMTTLPVWREARQETNHDLSSLKHPANLEESPSQSCWTVAVMRWKERSLPVTSRFIFYEGIDLQWELLMA